VLSIAGVTFRTTWCSVRTAKFNVEFSCIAKTLGHYRKMHNGRIRVCGLDPRGLYSLTRENTVFGHLYGAMFQKKGCENKREREQTPRAAKRKIQ
jgi:hypothetical protein